MSSWDRRVKPGRAFRLKPNGRGRKRGIQPRRHEGTKESEIRILSYMRQRRERSEQPLEWRRPRRADSAQISPRSARRTRRSRESGLGFAGGNRGNGGCTDGDATPSSREWIEFISAIFATFCKKIQCRHAGACSQAILNSHRSAQSKQRNSTERYGRNRGVDGDATTESRTRLDPSPRPLRPPVKWIRPLPIIFPAPGGAAPGA